MSASSRPRLLDKRTFYDQPRVVAEYDRLRFGSPSGEWVNQRELTLIAALLPPGGLVLDLGCGTGRLSRHLTARGYRVVALDVAATMLRVARAPTIPAVQADGFALPFAPASFDAVVALRVAFHYADLAGLLAAARDVLTPDGALVFDTYRWSPRALVALDGTRWGDKVFIHTPRAVATAARNAGLAVDARRSAFLFSPYLYRVLPLPLVRVLARIETRAPDRALARLFWRLTRVGD